MSTHVRSSISRMYDKSVKDSIAFGKHQRHMLKEHMRKQSALLAQPNEVKRLSDLLILEFRVSLVHSFIIYTFFKPKSYMAIFPTFPQNTALSGWVVTRDLIFGM